MNIALNITTAPQPLRSKPEVAKPSTKVSKMKTPFGASGGFSFDFAGGGHKVKAIVARRRPVAKTMGVTEVSPKLVTKRPETTKSVSILESSAQKEKSDMETDKSRTLASSKKSIALRRKAGEDAVKPAQIKNAEEVSSNKVTQTLPTLGELTLNVTLGVPSVHSLPSQTENRHERMNRKRTERLGNKNDRVLTEEEFEEHMNRFSQNPNKLPRPGDLLDQKERPELSKVHSKARNANASVKHINLFKNNPEAKIIGQRLVKPITERIFDGTKVDTLGLHPHAVKNLADLLSITELTTVQKKTIPKMLEGKDILVRSQTGSGKTLAYALPLVEKLQEIRPKVTRETGIVAVIIVPTRELAVQTYELLLKLLKPFTWIVPGVLIGGERRKAEKARLRKGINILVGTPGRLVDHLLHTESFKLSNAKFLILDEADRLLEMGYERDVKQIVDALNKQREQLSEETKVPACHLQRLLLSATLTSAVQKLAGLTLQDPIFIDNSDEDSSNAIINANGYTKEAIEAAVADVENEDDTGVLTIPENLKLNYVVVPPKLRLVTLSGLLAHEYRGKQKLKAIVFMSTMEMVSFHHDLLNEVLTQKVLDEDDEKVANGNEGSESDGGDELLLKGLRFFGLHGSMTQTERQGVFKGFRECTSGVLLATDVVGRGIDVAEVDLVIQYSPPQKTADFVHRAGRTARAGRSGRAVLFLAPSEADFVRYLEEKRIRISQVDMDVYLRTLHGADDAANTIQEAASNLQHKFENLIGSDRHMNAKACKAFVSWTKFYLTFPKELKSIFNIQKAHMGHFAKSFALNDPPSSFIQKHSEPKPAPPTNRLTYTERDPEKMKLEKTAKKRRYATTVTGQVRNVNRQEPMANKLVKMLSTARSLNVSEFDSGLPALKKRKP